MSEDIKRKQEYVLSELEPIYNEFCNKRDEIINMLSINPNMKIDYSKLSDIRIEFAKKIARLLSKEIKSNSFGKEINGKIDFYPEWKDFMEYLEKNNDFFKCVIEGFKETNTIDLLIRRLNDNKDDLINQGGLTTNDIDGLLGELSKVKKSYLYSITEEDIDSSKRYLDAITNAILQYGYDIYSSKTFKEQITGRSNPNGDKDRLLEIIDKMVNFLKNNKKVISSGDTTYLYAINALIRELTNVKEDFIDNKINSYECFNRINLNSEYFKKYSSERTGNAIDLYECIKEGKKSKRPVNPDNRENSNPVSGTSRSSRNEIDFSEIDTYDKLLVMINNYINLMEKERMFATRSKEAVEEGRNSEESIKRYGDLLLELNKINIWVQDKTGSVESYRNRLKEIATILRDDYNISLNKEDVKVRHRVTKVRKGNIRGLLGTLATNAVFINGLLRIPSTIKSYSYFGFGAYGIMYTVETLIFIIVPILIDLHRKSKGKKEVLIIETLLKKMIGKIEEIKSDIADKKIGQEEDNRRGRRR